MAIKTIKMSMEDMYKFVLMDETTRTPDIKLYPDRILFKDKLFVRSVKQKRPTYLNSTWNNNAKSLRILPLLRVVFQFKLSEIDSRILNIARTCLNPNKGFWKHTHELYPDKDELSQVNPFHRGSTIPLEIQSTQELKEQIDYLNSRQQHLDRHLSRKEATRTDEACNYFLIVLPKDDIPLSNITEVNLVEYISTNRENSNLRVGIYAGRNSSGNVSDHHCFNASRTTTGPNKVLHSGNGRVFVVKIMRPQPNLSTPDAKTWAHKIEAIIIGYLFKSTRRNGRDVAPDRAYQRGIQYYVVNEKIENCFHKLDRAEQYEMTALASNISRRPFCLEPECSKDHTLFHFANELESSWENRPYVWSALEHIKPLDTIELFLNPKPNQDYPTSSIYFERQTALECGLCCVNHCLQSQAFTRESFDEVASNLQDEFESLYPSAECQCFCDHEGNYSVEVMCAALKQHNYELIRFHDYENEYCRFFKTYIRMAQCFVFWEAAAGGMHHWVCYRRFEAQFYELNSILSSPKKIDDIQKCVLKCRNEGGQVFIVRGLQPIKANSSNSPLWHLEETIILNEEQHDEPKAKPNKITHSKTPKNSLKRKIKLDPASDTSTPKRFKPKGENYCNASHTISEMETSSLSPDDDFKTQRKINLFKVTKQIDRLTLKRKSNTNDSKPQPQKRYKNHLSQPEKECISNVHSGMTKLEGVVLSVGPLIKDKFFIQFSDGSGTVIVEFDSRNYYSEFGLGITVSLKVASVKSEKYHGWLQLQGISVRSSSNDIKLSDPIFQFTRIKHIFGAKTNSFIDVLVRIVSISAVQQSENGPQLTLLVADKTGQINLILQGEDVCGPQCPLKMNDILMATRLKKYASRLLMTIISTLRINPPIPETSCL